MSRKPAVRVAAFAMAAAIPAAGLALLAPTAVAAEPAPAGTLKWETCAKVANGWDEFTRGDTKAECATLSVPLDHARPDGRKINIAVSRLKAADPAKRRGVVVTNPGGPGGSGITLPLAFPGSELAPLAAEYDIIGFDPRGVGYSDKLKCSRLPQDTEDPPSSFTDKQKAKFRSDQRAAYYKRCAEKDIDFARQLTTASIAKDVDAIRVALGEKKISYYGISWGTALGAAYRSLFGGNLDRMLLDSVMPARFDLKAIDHDTDAASENRFNDFTSWIARYDSVYQFGATAAEVRTALFALRDQLASAPRVIGSGQSQIVIDGEAVTRLMLAPRGLWSRWAKDLATIRDGDVPDFARQTEAKAAAAAEKAGRDPRFGFDERFEYGNDFQNHAVVCNEGLNSRDFETIWKDWQERKRLYPAAGGIAHFASRCTGWPLPVQPWNLKQNTSSLQLVGHSYESVTPLPWALSMRKKIGGALLTVEDDVHGSLMDLPCAAKAVTYFREGKVSNESCPGAPIPTPDTGARLSAAERATGNPLPAEAALRPYQPAGLSFARG
ncbi:alpha/beta fold hydrolase [Streptoalloteichus hindustanus]|nr:alpha/beta fold hydrolase [Streptoalloteichus hindustanus]